MSDAHCQMLRLVSFWVLAEGSVVLCRRENGGNCE